MGVEGVEARSRRPLGWEYVWAKVAWLGCGVEALAPKREVQAWRAEAWTVDGSCWRVIVRLSGDVFGEGGGIDSSRILGGVVGG